MKRIIVVFVALLFSQIANAQGVGGGIFGLRSHDHSGAAKGGGSLNLSGSLASTKACAAGYTRKTPNFCMRDAGASTGFTSLSRDTCTTVAAPANALLVLVRMRLELASENVVGLRIIEGVSFATSACSMASGVHSYVQFASYEEVAKSAVIFAKSTHLLLAPVASGNIFIEYFDSSANGGNGLYRIEGYFD